MHCCCCVTELLLSVLSHFSLLLDLLGLEETIAVLFVNHGSTTVLISMPRCFDVALLLRHPAEQCCVVLRTTAVLVHEPDAARKDILSDTKVQFTAVPVVLKNKGDAMCACMYNAFSGWNIVRPYRQEMAN